MAHGAGRAPARSVASALRLTPPLVVLALLVAASALVRTVLAQGVAAPWIAPDEPLYGLIGRSLAGDAVPISAGTETSFLTPLLFALALLAVGDIADSVSVFQALQAILVSGAAVVAYAWARPLAGSRWALVAAFLTVVIPGLAYSGLLMTETMFYVTTTLALLSLARMIEKPTFVAQAVFLAATGLAVAARLQGFALLVAGALAICVVAAMERSTTLLRQTAPLLATIAIVLAGALAALLSGLPALGVYSAAVTGGYEPGAVLEDVFHHLGAVFLIAGGAPLVALGFAAVSGPFSGAASRPYRALVAVALAWTAVAVAQVGVFASQFVGHLAERDLLTVAPPLFVLFVVWLARGLPRRTPWAYAAAAAAAVPALALPVATLATDESRLDSFSMISVHLLERVTPDGIPTLVWVAWVVVTAVAVFAVPRRFGPAVVVVTVLSLVSLSVVAAREVRAASRADERWWFSEASPRWIDENARGPVTFLYAGNGEWGGVWKHVFWNRRIAAVATIDAAEPVPGPLRQSVVAPGFDGGLYDPAGSPLVSAYVVAPNGMALEGTAVSSIGRSGTLAGLVLWRTSGAVTVDRWVRGLLPGNELPPGSPVQVTAWNCLGATLALTVYATFESEVRVGAPGWRERSVVIPASGAANLELEAPPGTERCEFAITASAPASITQLEIRRPN